MYCSSNYEDVQNFQVNELMHANITRQLETWKFKVGMETETKALKCTEINALHIILKLLYNMCTVQLVS